MHLVLARNCCKIAPASKEQENALADLVRAGRCVVYILAMLPCEQLLCGGFPREFKGAISHTSQSSVLFDVIDMNGECRDESGK